MISARDKIQECRKHHEKHRAVGGRPPIKKLTAASGEHQLWHLSKTVRLQAIGKGFTFTIRAVLSIPRKCIYCSRTISSSAKGRTTMANSASRENTIPSNGKPAGKNAFRRTEFNAEDFLKTIRSGVFGILTERDRAGFTFGLSIRRLNS